MREGGGAYTWSNTSVKEKVGLSAGVGVLWLIGRQVGLLAEKYGI